MFRAAVIALSDKGFIGQRVDTSGKAIQEILKNNNYEIVSYFILPDDENMIKEELIRLCDNNLVDIIITTGGTGLSKRDCTPEATIAIADKMVPGISEAIRAYSMSITKRGMMSRGVSVIRKDTLIINLPGSEKAVRECLEYIIEPLKHGIEIMTGQTSECGSNSYISKK